MPKPFAPDTREWTSYESPSVREANFLHRYNLPTNPTDFRLEMQRNGMRLLQKERTRTLRQPVMIDCSYCDKCWNIQTAKPPVPHVQPLDYVPAPFPKGSY